MSGLDGIVASHILIMGSFRDPPSYLSLSAEQIAQVKRVRLTAQLYMFKPNEVRFQCRGTNPEVATVCIRYTDWWHWERNEPLRIATHGWKDIKFPSSVQKVVMELETRDAAPKKAELERIINGWFEAPGS